MRFKSKRVPNYNEERTVIKFAFFPVKIDDWYIWLEEYESVQRFNAWEEWEEKYKRLINKSPLKDGKGDLSCITEAAKNIEKKYGKG
jgi:hypothetical protein